MSAADDILAAERAAIEHPVNREEVLATSAPHLFKNFCMSTSKIKDLLEDGYDCLPRHVQEADQALLAYFGNEVYVRYSVPFNHTDVAFGGRCQIVLPVSRYFSDVGAKAYRSEVLDSPTWFCLAVHATWAMRRVKDMHHRYFEDYQEIGTRRGTAILQLTMGS